jgi:adhesin/invasin
VLCATSGTLISGTLQNVMQVAGGSSFCAACTWDGYVYTWGYNAHGELGNGLTSTQNFAVRVLTSGTPSTSNTNYLNHIVSIAAGYDHVLAVKDDGSVWA